MLKRARKYNKKIDLYAVSEVSDGFGGYKTTDVKVASLWCYMTTMSANSRFNFGGDSFGTIDLANSVRLIFRYNPNLTFNYKNMYFMYRGFKYTIQNNAININYSNKEVEVYATKENIPVLPDIIAPSVPTGVVISNITGSSAVVSYDASTDNSGGVITYEIFVDLVSQGTTTNLTFPLSGLSEITSYSVTVTARDESGNVSNASTPVVFETLDVTAPTVPTGVNITDITGSTANVNWIASTDNSGGIITYEVFVDSVSQGTTTNLSFALSGLSDLTSYSVTVSASDESGNVSNESTPVVFETLDITAPTVPTNVVISNITETTADVNWTQSTDNSGGVITYEVFVDGVLQGSTTLTTFSLTGLTLLTSYSVTLKAIDESGNESALSVPVNFSTVDLTAPSVPSGVAVTNITQTTADVSWLASTDNSGGTITYEIFVDGISQGTTTSLTFGLTGLTLLTSYSVTVNASDVSGNTSALSTPVVFDTIDVTAPTIPTNVVISNIGETTADVSWTASTDNSGGVITYEIFVDSVSQGTTTLTTFALSGLSEITSYSVTLKAIDESGNESGLTTPVVFETLDVTAPSVPTGVAISNITETTADVDWLASTDNSGGTITYEVFANGVSQGTTTLLTLSLSGLSSGTSYDITVNATDPSGNTSALSTAVNFITGYLLDTYAGATSAHSLRKLSASSINAIRVRRSTDNAEQDIGFSGNDLDTVSLLSFVGAGDGFVATWYDQASTKDLIQTSASAQPRIVSSGVIDTVNGKPTIYFDGVNDYLKTTTNYGALLGNSARSHFSVAEAGIQSDVFIFAMTDPSPTTGDNWWYNTQTSIRVFGNRVWGNSRQVGQSIGSLLFAGGVGSTVDDINFYLNGALQTSTSSTGATINTQDNPLSMGGIAGAFFNEGYVQENITFNTDESANRVPIETEINNYYNTY